jgi:hypothetical protein
VHPDSEFCLGNFIGASEPVSDRPPPWTNDFRGPGFRIFREKGEVVSKMGHKRQHRSPLPSGSVTSMGISGDFNRGMRKVAREDFGALLTGYHGQDFGSILVSRRDKNAEMI